MQQQWQHEIGKTVGMRHGNHAQVRPVRPQSHCRHNVINIRRQLFPGEGDRARRTGGGGGDFEMAAGCGRNREGRHGLIGFQRTNDGMRLPCAEHGQHEFSGVPLRMHDCSWPRGKVFRVARQFGKTPLPTRSQLAQREVVPAFLCDFAPAFVKHCLLVTQDQLLSKHDFASIASGPRKRSASKHAIITC